MGGRPKHGIHGDMQALGERFAGGVVLAVLSVACPAAAAPDPTIAALGRLPSQIASALFAGDVTTLRAMCTPEATVVDEFPPHLWTGHDACARFANDFGVLARRVHLTSITAETTSSVVTRSPGRVYAIAQVTLTPVVGDKPMPEHGTWTFVLVRSPRGWKIASMTWGTLAS